MLDLYELKDGQVTQLRVALDKFEGQIEVLARQKRDIEQAMEELTRTMGVVSGMLRDREEVGTAEAAE